VKRTFVVGLTGGIGSGKSAAADEFARLGATVVDTDAIAHELTRAGGGAVAGVRRLFGDSFVEACGAMDREAVRALVFAEPAARKKLEALLHPMIREESERRIRAATGEYVDMIAEGILDPAKVTRSALQNAASIASLLLTAVPRAQWLNYPTPGLPRLPDGKPDLAGVWTVRGDNRIFGTRQGGTGREQAVTPAEEALKPEVRERYQAQLQAASMQAMANAATGG